MQERKSPSRSKNTLMRLQGAGGGGEAAVAGLKKNFLFLCPEMQNRIRAGGDGWAQPPVRGEALPPPSFPVRI